MTLTSFALSSAELNIAETDLARPELWTGRSSGQGDSERSTIRFRPWHWPRLLDAPDLLQRLVKQVTLDTKILETLGLDGDARIAFTQDQLDPLGDQPDTVTFRQFATASPMGLRLKDRQDQDHVLARIAAAGIHRWLERTVLPSQNVLIDAPHLAQRYPGLIAPGDNQISWDALADLGSFPAGASLDPVVLASAVIPACDWLSRPVWSWPAASAAARALQRTGSEPGLVFCEDVSAFVPLAQATEFTSSVYGTHRQRFVYELEEQKGDSVEYRPPHRLYVVD